MGTLSEQAIERVSGPAWQPLKAAFLDLSRMLLDVAPDAVGELTTIYVKYQVNAEPQPKVFAVAWLKTSKQIVVGLALPEDYEASQLGPAPAGTKYKGITRYFRIEPGDAIPSELPEWAKLAYTTVTSTEG
jgi:hypothetical protein